MVRGVFNVKHLLMHLLKDKHPAALIGLSRESPPPFPELRKVMELFCIYLYITVTAKNYEY